MSSCNYTIEERESAYECIGVQENPFVNISQGPTVDFRESDSELGSRHQFQTILITGIQRVHQMDQVERFGQDISIKYRYIRLNILKKKN